MSRSATPIKLGKGFTVMELLVVVALMGLLLAVLLLGAQTLQRSARVTQTLAEFNAAATDLEVYRNETGEYPFTGFAAPWPTYEYSDTAPADGITSPWGSVTESGEDDSLSETEDLPDYLQMIKRDGFGYPILYYRANPGAGRMTTRIKGHVGIYNQDDNSFFTGDGFEREGIDLGAGTGHRLNQFLADGTEVEVHSSPSETDLNDPIYERTFARFIWHQEIETRNEPVNKSSYLLISPGPDALWGTQDDITNFE